ncbi:MAG TPA: FixH family protein [Patescibacteria group bacterium]|nr:FixH family protein [Patescibacteria group bacterium]
MAGAARQPMIWLVVALTLTALAASVWTVRSARGPLASSPDDVQRIAQIQTTDAGRDRRALELDVRAVLEIGTQGMVVTSTSPAIDPSGDLELRLIHATDAMQDRLLALTPCAPGVWCSDEKPADARYRIELLPRDGAWRIVGARDPAKIALVALEPAWSSR